MAGNLKRFLIAGDVVGSKSISSLLTAGGNSNWGTLRGPENLFVSTGTGGGGASATGAFKTVDWTLGVLLRVITSVEAVP